MPSDQPCPRPCNRRYWAARDAYKAALDAYDPLDPEQSRPQEPDTDGTRGGQPVWCAEHTAQIRLHLAQLDDLAAVYAQAADGHRTAPPTQRIGGVSVVMSPSEIHDALEELTSALLAWEDAYRKYMGWPAPPPRGDDATVQTTCIAWLTRHLDGILASPAAEQTGRAILTWRSSIAGKAKTSPRTILLPVRCPGAPGRPCGQRLLVWVEGTDRVDCGNPDCQKIMTKAECDIEAERQIKMHEILLHRGRSCDCPSRAA